MPVGAFDVFRVFRGADGGEDEVLADAVEVLEGENALGGRLLLPLLQKGLTGIIEHLKKIAGLLLTAAGGKVRVLAIAADSAGTVPGGGVHADELETQLVESVEVGVVLHVVLGRRALRELVRVARLVDRPGAHGVLVLRAVVVVPVDWEPVVICG